MLKLSNNPVVNTSVKLAVTAVIMFAFVFVVMVPLSSAQDLEVFHLDRRRQEWQIWLQFQSAMEPLIRHSL